MQLRRSRDFRDVFCLNPGQSTAPPGFSGKRLPCVLNGSVGYQGDLMVKCVPAGSTWEIVLSDAALTDKEKNERAKAKERKAIEAHVARLQKKADDLAPPEPAPPLMIERRREREPVRIRRR